MAYDPSDAPRIQVDYRRLDFLHVPVGEPVTEPFTVGNVGAGDLVVTSVSFDSGDPLEVVGDGCTGATLATDQTCGFSVRWFPESRSGVRDTLRIVSNDPEQPEWTRQVEGDAVVVEPEPTLPPSGQLTIDRASATFPEVRVGEASELVWFTLTNAGPGPVYEHTAHVDGIAQFDFVIVHDTCPYQTLWPDDTCEMAVAFVPTESGQRRAQLYAADVPVELSGRALAAPGAKTGHGCSAAPAPGRLPLLPVLCLLALSWLSRRSPMWRGHRPGSTMGTTGCGQTAGRPA
jgi:hypothetical protein